LPITSGGVASALTWIVKDKSEAESYFNFNWASGYSGTFNVDTFAMLGDKLLIIGVALDNVSGGTIGTSGTAVVGTCSIRPKTIMSNLYACNFPAIDYSRSNAQIRIGIMGNGDFCVMESVGVSAGSNHIRGTLVVPI